MSGHRCTFRRPVPLPSIITLAVRWYLGLSYRDVEELLAERGIDMDHTTVHRWVPRFTPLFVEGPALPARVRRSPLVRGRNGLTTSSARSSRCCWRSDGTRLRLVGSSPRR